MEFILNVNITTSQLIKNLTTWDLLTALHCTGCNDGILFVRYLSCQLVGAGLGGKGNCLCMLCCKSISLGSDDPFRLCLSSFLQMKCRPDPLKPVCITMNFLVSSPGENKIKLNVYFTRIDPPTFQKVKIFDNIKWLWNEKYEVQSLHGTFHFNLSPKQLELCF